MATPQPTGTKVHQPVRHAFYPNRVENLSCAIPERRRQIVIHKTVCLSVCPVIVFRFSFPNSNVKTFSRLVVVSPTSCIVSCARCQTNTQNITPGQPGGEASSPAERLFRLKRVAFLPRHMRSLHTRFAIRTRCIIHRRQAVTGASSQTYAASEKLMLSTPFPPAPHSHCDTSIFSEG